MRLHKRCVTFIYHNITSIIIEKYIYYFNNPKRDGETSRPPPSVAIYPSVFADAKLILKFATQYDSRPAMFYKYCHHYDYYAHTHTGGRGTGGFVRILKSLASFAHSACMHRALIKRRSLTIAGSHFRGSFP